MLLRTSSLAGHSDERKADEKELKNTTSPLSKAWVNELEASGDGCFQVDPVENNKHQ